MFFAPEIMLDIYIATTVSKLYSYYGHFRMIILSFIINYITSTITYINMYSRSMRRNLRIRMSCCQLSAQN